MHAPHAFTELERSTVGDYVLSQPTLRDRLGRVLDVQQSGEGKINGVFFVTGERATVVLKQGLPWVRVLPDWELTAERVGREARLLERWSSFNPEYVPLLWQYDDREHVLAMENLTEHELLRDVLAVSSGEPEVGDAVGVMLARAAYYTSALSMPTTQFLQAVRDGQNPEMSHLMEDVVFTIPFSNSDQNVTEPVLVSHREALLANPEVVRAVGYLKWVFATRQEALIHGDLHAGSLLVRGSDTRVIDAEFGRYGPVAWDMGAFWAHVTIAAEIHDTRGDHDLAAATRQLVSRSWGTFRAEVLRLADSDESRFPLASVADWIDETHSLAARFAGIEIVRRIVGVGNCEQLTDLGDEQRHRATAALIEHGTRALIGAPGAPSGQNNEYA